jgi:transposase
VQRTGLSQGSGRSDCVFSVFYRRIKAHIGPAQATVATARLIARVYYRMLKDKVEYQPLSVEEYQTRCCQKQVRYLQKKAARLGFQLTPA